MHEFNKVWGIYNNVPFEKLTNHKQHNTERKDNTGLNVDFL